MSELFTLFPSQKQKELESPLADRMRPVSLDEIVGQKSILGNEKPLRQQIKNDHLPSLILWGPPGSGKTTIARVIAQETKAAFYSISAVMAGVKELKEILE
ncbi:MAG: AAA family ATPase, partial [Deltaproteobacteria bacterium]|nr:AAA family ATPase [Deltaproteobacteria bacterium]